VSTSTSLGLSAMQTVSHRPESCAELADFKLHNDLKSALFCFAVGHTLTIRRLLDFQHQTRRYLRLIGLLGESRIGSSEHDSQGRAVSHAHGDRILAYRVGHGLGHRRKHKPPAIRHGHSRNRPPRIFPAQDDTERDRGVFDPSHTAVSENPAPT